MSEHRDKKVGQLYKADQIKQTVLEKLKRLGQRVLTDLESGRYPELQIPARTTRNIVYDPELRQYVLGRKQIERTTRNIRHLRPFAQLLWVATFAKQLIQTGKTSTLRDTYYVAIGEGIDFEDQKESDETIVELETLIDSPREDFNIFPEERASIYGDLVIEYTVPGFRGKRVDLSAHPDGFTIGPALTSAEFVRCGAEMLFVIEKGAVFSRFVEEGADKKHKAILIHTAGQSPRNCRKLIRRLHDELNLPIYVFSVDGDEPVLILENGYLKNKRIRDLFPTHHESYTGSGILNTGQLIFIERALLIDTMSPAILNNGEMIIGNVEYVLRHDIHEPLLEIKLAGGFSVKATSSHSVMVFEDYVLKPREARNIKIYDLIPVCLNVPEGRNINELNLVKLIVKEAPHLIEDIWYIGNDVKNIKVRYSSNRILWRRVKKGTAPLAELVRRKIVPLEGWIRYGKSEKKIPVKLKVSEELGRLLGYFTAKGSIESNDSGVRLTFGKQQMNYVEDASRCIKKIFGMEPSISRGPHFINVHIYGSVVAKLFKEVLKTGDRAENKEVPYIILNAPKHVKLNYLIGYLRGGRRIKNDKFGFQIQSSTVSRKLASDLLLLYRQLGAHAYVEHRTKGKPHLIKKTGQLIKPKKDYYVISIRDKLSLKKIFPVLIDLIGREAAEKILSIHHKKSSLTQSIPVSLITGAEHSFISAAKDRESLKKIKKILNYIRAGYKSPISRISLDKLKELLSLCDKAKFDYKLKFIENVVMNGLTFLPVKEIREVISKEGKVYDIEVEGAHTFIGGVGGILLHNTDADPYGVHIASVLIHGSALSAHIKRINVPDAVWAGVWASDIRRYKLPSMKLTEQDIKRLRELEGDPRYQVDPWRRELKEFWKIKRKAELEAFSRYGLDFIVKEFLPERLAELQKR